MQNGTLDDGFSEHQQTNHCDDNNVTPTDTQPQPWFLRSTTPLYQHDDNNPESDESKNEGSPAKKRKLTNSTTPQPSTTIRPISPPWKRIAVDGPTSFVEGGRRKSSRTNFLPLELQPQAEKRQTRAAIQKTQVLGSKHGGISKPKPSPLISSTNLSQANGKRPPSAGKSTVNTFTKSPMTSIQHRAPSNKLSVATSAASPFKRSHKKGTHPIASRASPSQSQRPTSPHQNRRSGRASAGVSTRGKAQEMRTNAWLEIDESQASEEDEDMDEQIVVPGPSYKPQRLNLKVRMPVVTTQHPEHVLLPRRFPSFQGWLDQEGSLAADNPVPMTVKEAVRESQLRRRIIQATQPGGVLSKESCSLYVPDPQDEPPQQYAHQDHLLAHALYFHKLMVHEHERHKRNAKRIALAAAAEWQRKQPKTKEQIEKDLAELYVKRVKQMLTDLSQKWAIIASEVQRRRLERHRDEKQLQGRKALNRLLEQSTQLLDNRRQVPAQPGGNGGGESEEEGMGSQESQASGSDLDSYDEDNMSTSQSESEEGQAVNDDEGLSTEELRQKYAAIQYENSDEFPTFDEASVAETCRPYGKTTVPYANVTTSSNAESPNVAEVENPEQLVASIAVDEVDDVLMDDSDESTDMEDDSSDIDENSMETDDEESDAASDDAGLLGFFDKKDYINAAEISREYERPLIDEKTDMSEDEVEEVSLIPDATQVQTPSASNSEEPYLVGLKARSNGDVTDASRPSHYAGNTQIAHSPCTHKPETERSSLINLITSDSVSHDHGDSLPTTPVSTDHGIMPVQTPSLLRGILREYQQFGLDWLAKGYRDSKNGILADEMGLGKTIQTIALLAHLAERHEAWGPHLIVVPTSVMLNWEMEFKKFLPGFKVLTYYGTQDERKRKRTGWMDDDKWNVWITSYALILQDNQIFKRKAWHYMVLDEAHNIKNFRSKRWQMMLTFRTHSRLLLTGTPLQNNLTELWSLLAFLIPPESEELQGLSDLAQWTNWFRNPVDQIMEGKETIDQEGKNIVAKLHKVLRPFLLRRLKADVEKQMPGKTEYVLYCKLSKRQRYLYDGFMSRAQTRETLATGNFLKIINCLMQLRKVCNHPDLFETRQIVTSFAMKKSAVADYEIKELLVRRRLLRDEPVGTVDLNVVNLLPGTNERLSALDTIQKQRLGAIGTLRQLTSQAWSRVDQGMEFDATSVESTLASMENAARRSRFEELRHSAYLTSLRSQRRPLYSYSLMERLKVDLLSLPSSAMPKQKSHLADWFSKQSSAMAGMVLTLPQRSNAMQTTLQKFACVTPAVVASDLVPLALSQGGKELIRSVRNQFPTDAFHQARMHLSIAFPDKRLLQYDCGKLQRLDVLLRKLQDGGHRALIFTQMTRVLDILEQFLNIHGHRYLRLDGQTKVEQRQIMTERFNSDKRIDVFILSSRSGGLGINLTGADTVIFYDSDWNPAMDKQCQDRCHRIGQTRDVSVYRLVSEYTIEANILRKANQKRRLDDVVIQDGAFTTDYFNKSTPSEELIGEEALDGDADANAAMDRVFGDGGAGRAFDEAEDVEDIAAARIAEKEIINTDAADFDDRVAVGSGDGATPKTPAPTTPREILVAHPSLNETPTIKRAATLEAAGTDHTNFEAISIGQDGEVDEPGHIDDLMLRHMEWEYQDIPVKDPDEKNRKKRSRKGGEEHGVRKK